MKYRRKLNNDALFYETLKNAINGDVSAINALLKHYAPYITKMATKELFDEEGNAQMVYDEDIKREIEIKFITGLLNFQLS